MNAGSSFQPPHLHLGLAPVVEAAAHLAVAGGVRAAPVAVAGGAERAGVAHGEVVAAAAPGRPFPGRPYSSGPANW